MLINRIEIRNLTILLGSAFTVFSGAVIAPALPEMAVAFQNVPSADFLVRLTLTMPALFSAIGAPFAGFLLDHWGRKPVLLASLILYGLAGASGFILNSLFGILAGRAFLGLAVAGIMSGFTTLIADYFTGARLNRFMGYQGAAIGLGGMVFLLVSGYLANIGWRFPFLIYLFAFLTLPGMLFAVDEPKIRAEAVQQPTSTKKASLRTIALIYATAFAGMFIFFVLVVQLPFYLTAQAGASSSQVGLALSFNTLISVITALQYERLRARLSFQGIFIFAFIVLGINHLIVALTPIYRIIVVGLLIGGLGPSILQANLSVWLASITPSMLRGRAMGGLIMFIFLGQFFTPIITQPVVENLGLARTFGVTGVVSLLISVVFAGHMLKRRCSR